MEKRLYETGKGLEIGSAKEEEEKHIFTAPIDMVYKFNINGTIITKHLKKNQSVNLKEYRKAVESGDSHSI